MTDPQDHLQDLERRCPSLVACRQDIVAAYRLLESCYAAGGKLLLCGNGGSAADCDHIAGELMKGFLLRRPLPEEARKALEAGDPEMGPGLAAQLQGALPAVNLAAQSALSTAFANDVNAELVFAQQVMGHGRRGDVLMGISTSGNSLSVLAALAAARGTGLGTIGLTGQTGGRMKGRCAVLIRVPAARTHEIQELHLPVYHCLCAMLEARFFTS
jgi:D-sedoheptulose 7-phosphate isomerase